MIGDLLDGYRVLAFDLETTGISTRRDRIVQIALVGADENGEQIHYDEIVNPGIPIPFEASNVHGIFDADVRGKEKFKDILSTCLLYTSPSPRDLSTSRMPSSA